LPTNKVFVDFADLNEILFGRWLLYTVRPSSATRS